MGLRTICMAVLLCGTTASSAQDTLNDQAVEQIVESIIPDNDDEEADYLQLTEHLAYLREKPLDLNRATRADLEALMVLSAVQVENLLQHIRAHGPLIALHELQSIEGFSLHLIRSIWPYVRVGRHPAAPSFELDVIGRYRGHQLILRYGRVLEEQKGFSEGEGSRYLGGPEKLFLKYRFNYYNRVSWGLTAEKDAGEEFFKGSQQAGFDFYSAHFFLKDVGRLRTLALGDYQFGFGQGLMAWSSLAFTKTPDAMSVKKPAIGLRPYTSTDENRFLRGAAIQLGRKVVTTLFFSSHGLDANAFAFANGKAIKVSSLQQTGLHTTRSEVSDKHSVSQRIAGLSAHYARKKLNLGLLAMYTSLSAELDRTPAPYNRFYFTGRDHLNAGGTYSVVRRNSNFFGELAFSYSEQGGLGYALLQGFVAALDPRLSLSVIRRNYARNYHSFLGNGFSEGGRTANEHGTYAGLTFRLTNTLILNAWYDRFRFPWLKFEVNAPSQGSEYMVQVTYTPAKRTEMYLRFRRNGKQSNMRLHFSSQLSRKIRLQHRLELLELEGKKERGYLVYIDLNCKLRKLNFAGRYTLFSTDSYNSRIYAYETEVPGAFSIPFHYYRGTRFYLLAGYAVTGRLGVWLRLAQTWYANREVISPGSLNEIDGNTRTDAKAQLRLKF